MDVGQVLVVAVIKGTGKEEVGTKIFMFSMYGCGFLSSYILVFGLGLETPGFMYGMAIGVSVMFILGIRVVKQTNLEEQSKEIQERMQESGAVETHHEQEEPVYIEMKTIEA